MLSHWDAVSTLDRMFDDMMGSALGTATNPHTFTPAVDVRTSEDQIVLVFDVPGIKREELDVTVHNRVLTIKGARRYQSKDGEKVVLGRAYGTFQRAFTLPECIDESKLSADLADGVLTVAIPKQPKAKPQKVNILSR